MPIAFALVLVMSGFGMSSFAAFVGPALVSGFLAFVWVGRMGGEDPPAVLATEALAGTLVVGLAGAGAAVALSGATVLSSAAVATLVFVAAAGVGVWLARRRSSETAEQPGTAPTAHERSGFAKEVVVAAKALVGIIMGSESDKPVMDECARQLEELGVPFEMLVASAHRQPEKVHAWASGAADRGLCVIVAAAGKAAHLGGVAAAYTTLPVITVPMKTSDLGGLDSLLSMVQMPAGVPVACVAINGARNAAILATQILATSMPTYRDALESLKSDMAKG